MSTLMNLFFGKRDKSSPRVGSVVSFAGRPAAPPAPVSPNPAIRDMETTLASLVYRVTEVLAKTELYFPASDLQVLGMPGDKTALCKAANKMACALLLRPDVKRGERYVAFAGEIADALCTAERTATLLRILCTDPQNSPAVPLVRRVADAFEIVVNASAKVLNAEAVDVFRHSNALVAARNDAETAVHKAITMLQKKPAILQPASEKLAKTIIWSLDVIGSELADAALECRGVMLPVASSPMEMSAPKPTFAFASV
ncbi:MAG: hypothetical protein H7Y38_14275 [Armatimonadetes bacterium]|nr:hypothetical protein [Armatimonadota bacterium]